MAAKIDKDTCAGCAAEHTQVENKQQVVVDNGNGADLGGAQLTDHHIIQQRHQIGDQILQDDGQRYHQHLFIKMPITDKPAFHIDPS